MKRNKKVSLGFDGEMRKLFVYTSNMNDYLKRGANLMVDLANQGDIFTSFYKTKTVTLDVILNDIENSNSRVFREFENRISDYLNPEK